MNCIVCFVMFLAQTLTPEAVEHARAGMEAQKQGRLDVAIEEFRKVTEIAPDLAAAHVNLGAAYIQKKDYTQAITALEKSLALNPGLIGAHQMLGTAYLAVGDSGQAIPHLEKAKAYDMLGIAYLENGRLADAIGMLGDALNQNPSNPDLLYYFGRATALASKQAFDTMLAIDPNSARGHLALAEQYTALRQPAMAEKEYRAALQVRSDIPGLHLGLGELLAAGGKWPEAEVEFAAEAKLRPAHAETAWRLGSALLQQGKAGEALKTLERADSLQPDMPETLFALGKAALLTGDEARAEKSWTQQLSIEGETQLAAQAHFALAGLYRKRGRIADADREMAAYRKLNGAVPGQVNKVVP